MLEYLRFYSFFYSAPSSRAFFHKMNCAARRWYEIMRWHVVMVCRDDRTIVEIPHPCVQGFTLPLYLLEASFFSDTDYLAI